MAFTNSPLAEMISISPNRTSPRNQPISKITIHHWAGTGTLETFKNIVMNPNRGMSANYAIDSYGHIGLFCPEGDRSWCSSSPWNDHRSVTIEVANSAYGDASGWPISEASYKSLIKLCVDICKRNGIKKLEFTGDRNGSLTYHYMFSQTCCLPIDRTELLTPFGWKLLKDIQIGDIVATAHIDNMSIKFDPVENLIPIKTQDTYITRDFEATSDHRVVYYNQAGRQYVGQFKDLYDLKASIYLPNAGFIENPEGFHGLGYGDIEFLIAVQADGHYMTDGDCRYGVEFHLKKERKIKRLKKIFEILGFKYTVCEQTDGTTKLRLYGVDYVNACEEYLNNKCFTWDWLNMNRKQVEYFMNAILQYDGCEANNSYSSSIPENVDIVQAIAAINGIGTKMSKEHDRVFFKKYMRSLGDNERQRKARQKVSCVTVRSGFILIRQHGRTTITGNCPGPWIKARTTEICNLVNAQLNGGSSTSTTTKPTTQPVKPSTGHTKSLKGNTVVYDAPNGKKVGTVGVDGVYTITEEKAIGNVTYGKLKSGKGWVIVKQTASQPTNTTSTFKVNDLVSIASNARYYNGGAIPQWVLQEKWYISSISGNRAVLGLNQSKNRNIQSPINTKYLTIATVPKQSSGWSGPVNSQIKELQQILNIGGAGLKVDGIAGDATFAACKKYTIEQGDTGNLIKWVQKRLGVTADGIAGPATMNAIYAFQRKNKLGVGYLGGDDWKYLIH